MLEKLRVRYAESRHIHDSGFLLWNWPNTQQAQNNSVISGFWGSLINEWPKTIDHWQQLTLFVNCTLAPVPTSRWADTDSEQVQTSKR